MLGSKVSGEGVIAASSCWLDDTSLGMENQVV